MNGNWKKVTDATDELRQRAWEFCRDNDGLLAVFSDFDDALGKCVQNLYNATHE